MSLFFGNIQQGVLEPLPHEDHLYLYYKFDNRSNVNYGTKGSDHDLEFWNRVTNTYSTNTDVMIENGYMESNGNEDGILTDHKRIAELDLIESFSWSCWVQNADANYNGFGTPMTFCFYNDAGDNGSWNMLLFRHSPLTGAEKRWYCQFYGGSRNAQINGPNNSAYNTNLTMLTATIDNGTMKFWINDSYIGSVDRVILSTSDNFYWAYFGLNGESTKSSGSKPPYQFKGKLWYPKLWKYVLTDSDVSDLYSRGNKQ